MDKFSDFNGILHYPNEKRAESLAPTRFRTQCNKESNSASSFSKEDDELLANLFDEGYGWDVITSHFPGKTIKQVKNHWYKVINPVLIRGSWTKEEDLAIIKWVKKHGPRNWSGISSQLKGRIPKQCRERYVNHLDPKINKSEFTEEEDKLIEDLVARYGTKWSKISKFFQGRTDNSIKNRYNAKRKRKDYLENFAMNISLPPPSQNMTFNLPQPNQSIVQTTQVRNGPIILAPLGSSFRNMPSI